MGVKVRLANEFLSYTDGRSVLDAEGHTVGAALQAAVDRNPELRRQLFDDEMVIRPFLRVALNGADVKGLYGLATEVRSGDEVMVEPATAGGTPI